MSEKIALKPAVAGKNTFNIGETEVCFGAAAQSYNHKVGSLTSGLLPFKKVFKSTVSMYVPAAEVFQEFKFGDSMAAFDPEGYMMRGAQRTADISLCHKVCLPLDEKKCTVCLTPVQIYLALLFPN